ncbi:MAG: RsiG family protein, partial [Acidimicrobiia bacterium]
MTMENRRRIDILLDSDFLTDLEAAPVAELRDRRRMADEVETELSFYRRLLHGRM